MNNEVEREVKKSKNKFELEGNVANINDIYTNQNGKKILSGGVQAYAWFYWDLISEKKQPIIKWISRGGENK